MALVLALAERKDVCYKARGVLQVGGEGATEGGRVSRRNQLLIPHLSPLFSSSHTSPLSLSFPLLSLSLSLGSLGRHRGLTARQERSMGGGSSDAQGTSLPPSFPPSLIFNRNPHTCLPPSFPPSLLPSLPPSLPPSLQGASSASKGRWRRSGPHGRADQGNRGTPPPSLPPSLPLLLQPTPSCLPSLPLTSQALPLRPSLFLLLFALPLWGEPYLHASSSLTSSLCVSIARKILQTKDKAEVPPPSLPPSLFSPPIFTSFSPLLPPSLLPSLPPKSSYP